MISSQLDPGRCLVPAHQDVSLQDEGQLLCGLTDNQEFHTAEKGKQPLNNDWRNLM
jgi:hypothetical protein